MALKQEAVNSRRAWIWCGASSIYSLLPSTQSYQSVVMIIQMDALGCVKKTHGVLKPRSLSSVSYQGLHLQPVSACTTVTIVVIMPVLTAVLQSQKEKNKKESDSLFYEGN